MNLFPTENLGFRITSALFGVALMAYLFLLGIGSPIQSPWLLKHGGCNHMPTNFVESNPNRNS